MDAGRCSLRFTCFWRKKLADVSFPTFFFGGGAFPVLIRDQLINCGTAFGLGAYSTNADVVNAITAPRGDLGRRVSDFNADGSYRRWRGGKTHTRQGLEILRETLINESFAMAASSGYFIFLNLRPGVASMSLLSPWCPACPGRRYHGVLIVRLFWGWGLCTYLLHQGPPESPAACLDSDRRWLHWERTGPIRPSVHRRDQQGAPQPAHDRRADRRGGVWRFGPIFTILTVSSRMCARARVCVCVHMGAAGRCLSCLCLKFGRCGADLTFSGHFLTFRTARTPASTSWRSGLETLT